MRQNIYRNNLLLLLCLVTFSLTAQKVSPRKYPSLMWEITGNGLTKPSYLFGTMHVSSKKAFHLSDSFYYAIKTCDVVALEQNPQVWQPEMYRLEDAQIALKAYTTNGCNDYLNENSFKLSEYESKLKVALSEEPSIVNGLLYRSYKAAADFEENTYLDLYIYQTGRKLGKKPAGVEDYLQTEKIVLEAYEDMKNEKKKKRRSVYDENYYDINNKIQDAYRRGDLDLMDSLQKLTYESDAFIEKFLYKRNEIQANSIDTIIKKQALFVGVGAAHLPGSRGVIEILRNMGYILRPVKMNDTNADEKDKIDKLKVPVVMQNVQTEDGFIKLRVPGKLFKRHDNRFTESWQYADMENGSYYMLSRVKTNAALVGQSEAMVLKKIDSLLYENIPGKILQKSSITKNGYLGFSIINKTRRSDIQRYNILVTPFEVLIFKMSGNDEYVNGQEADDFFNSIQIAEYKNGSTNFSTPKSGFAANFPHQPFTFFTGGNDDALDTWQYEAVDKTTGTAYAIWKKNVHNYKFMEEDTFDISLIEESFKRSEYIDKQISRKPNKINGYNALDMSFSLKNSGIVKTRAIIKGPHYYLLIATGKNSSASDQFFKSFKLKDYEYGPSSTYTDTALNFTVQTSVAPVFDTAIKKLAEQSMNSNGLNDESYNYWPKDKIASFRDDTSGECIMVTAQTFAKYYYIKDTTKFWKNQMLWKNLEKDFIINTKEFIQLPDSVFGYKYSLLDTNTSRKIIGLSLLKDNKFFKLMTLTDNIGNESSFINSFFNTFRPENKKLGPSVFVSKLDNFFDDYYSTDSTVKKKAKAVLSRVYYGIEGLEQIKKAVSKLKFSDKDYFELKEKFIAELGYIDDSCCTDKVIDYLKELYTETTDTSSFQNPIITSLTRLQTKKSYSLLKELLLQEPPVFDASYGYNEIFRQLDDSLLLAKSLFPELLQLTSLDDYKKPVISLLRILVDSGILISTDYQDYFNKLYFDAKVELKKQQNRDEKLIQKENSKEGDEDTYVRTNYSRNNNYYSAKTSGIEDYAILLMPFYDKNLAVQKFFDKLLVSKDDNLKLSTVVLMLRNNKKVADSIFIRLASKDDYRGRLFAELKKIKKTIFFPEANKNQELIAKSFLLNDGNKEKFYAIELVSKKLVEVKNLKGFVYFFKYKNTKDDEWMMGFSGIQPVNMKDVSDNDDFARMTNKKIIADEPEIEQFEKKLKEMIYAKRKSAQYFFTGNRNNSYRPYEDE
jgi:uncharacterized protein YbaP (TraB family)